MKKITSLVLSIVLVLTLSLSLIGCSEQQKFIGTWETSVDLADVFNEFFAAEDEEMAEYFEIEEFEIVLKMTFKDDGTYKKSVDKKSVEKAVDSLMETLEDGLTEYIEDVIDSQGLNMTVKDFLDASGTDMEDLVEDISAFDMDDIVSEFEAEGKFEVKDGKLYLSEDLDSDIDEDEYETYEISKNELKLIEAFGEDNLEDFEDLYPITFKKVS